MSDISNDYAFLKKDYNGIPKNTLVDIIEFVAGNAIVKVYDYKGAIGVDRRLLNDINGKMDSYNYMIIPALLLDIYADFDDLNILEYKHDKYALTTKEIGAFNANTLVKVYNLTIGKIIDHDPFYITEPIYIKGISEFDKTFPSYKIMHRCNYYFNKDIGYYINDSDLQVLDNKELTELLDGVEDLPKNLQEEVNRFSTILTKGKMIDIEEVNEDFGNVWN